MSEGLTDEEMKALREWFEGRFMFMLDVECWDANGLERTPPLPISPAIISQIEESEQ